MNSAFSFTSSWKEASADDLYAKQIASFIFPAHRFIARLKTPPAQLSITLWRESDRCYLMYLTHERLTADHLPGVLNVIADVLDHDTSCDDEFIARLHVHVIARDFDRNFLSKLRFLTMPVQTHRWTLSETNGKETVLVKEVPMQQPDLPVSGMSAETTSQMTAVEKHLSHDEISAFEQLSAELKKFTEQSFTS
ncbi:MAG: hypothetical protein COV74_08875 [Candidatus Omnitrophica bacterium CG11_big_fil_rev_8_21_14_0_20_45_26]|uniref:Uncharacterized protein n=1 Tax=Candidatus Abzuiibacterium crystallinum TaxID=1974748 RepID=A0A2H0LM51_9BACT|nr:MAG: hypothetical protein COV74_08875 [Candidatus Omnitrophica bacterium CG11_big_fil_rev_8_21_14_0_20_45_26]PIW64429.1 MAG: hypothetical protein COW12_06220 [Candidatus Omnitrophica bacterium CG12_big_fil_rev_8_21_14_0_65_45_16]